LFHKVKNVLKRRKAKLFFLFLILSGLAWFISNLSNRYQSNTFFDLEFVNPPDSMMLLKASEQKVEVRLDAEGFQFFAFGIRSKRVNIDLSEAKRSGTKYIVTPEAMQRQIEKQLSNGIQLVNTSSDTLVVEFYGVITKKLPIVPRVELQYTQNYLLEGARNVSPILMQISP